MACPAATSARRWSSSSGGAGLSAATITRLTAQWQDEADAFNKRSLTESDYVYLWVDGIHLKVRLEQDKVCLLVMNVVRADGRKELVALADGSRESTQSWAELLRSCRRRGMTASVLAVGDGALGGGRPCGRCSPLFGIKQRVRGGAKITDAQLRVPCDGLRRRQVASITADHAEISRNKSVRFLRAALSRHVGRALADAGSEQTEDTWDLAVFGHRGTLSVQGNQPALACPVHQTVGR